METYLLLAIGRKKIKKTEKDKKGEGTDESRGQVVDEGLAGE